MAQTLTQIGKYRIERELGRGAMGVVYEAYDSVVERRVAIKTIRLDVEDSENLLIRLKREAKSVGQLDHMNIVTLYYAGESDGLFYLAMQFIEGETLQSRLERQRWFTLKEIMELFAQICSGLDYAHSRGVIHRDVKPANIMITRNGVVKLTDFGIAKLAGGGGTSTSGLIVGTPSYMSPEQAVGKPLDGRSDIFSLGSILYEMLTGEKAFPGQNVTTVMYKIVHESPTPVMALQPGLDPAVEPIVLRALAKNPEARFQSCQEFALALQDYVNHSVPAHTISASIKSLHSYRASTSASNERPLVSEGVSDMSAAPQMAHASDSTATATNIAPRTATVLAWSAIGALGALLAVVIVMLALQLRKHAATNLPIQKTPPVSSVAPSPVNSSPESSSESAGTKPDDVPQTQTKSEHGRGEKTGENSNSRKNKERSSQIAEVKPPVAKPPVTNQPPVQDHEVVKSTQPELPETFSSLLLKADISYQQGHYEDALASYKKAYLLNSRNAEIKRKIAVVLTLLNRPEEAAKYH